MNLFWLTVVLFLRPNEVNQKIGEGEVLVRVISVACSFSGFLLSFFFLSLFLGFVYKVWKVPSPCISRQAAAATCRHLLNGAAKFTFTFYNDFKQLAEGDFLVMLCAKFTILKCRNILARNRNTPNESTGFTENNSKCFLRSPDTKSQSGNSPSRHVQYILLHTFFYLIFFFLHF